MSGDPTILDAKCPFCAGQLTGHFGTYFTEAVCGSCMAQIGWPAAMVHDKDGLEFMILGHRQHSSEEGS